MKNEEKWILRVCFEENAGFQEVGIYHSQEAVMKAEKKIKAFNPYDIEILKKMNL